MAAAVNPVGKGSGLGKKVGPLPLYGWVLIAVAIVGYFMFFRHAGSAAAAQKQQTNAQTPSSALGDVPQAGSPGDSGGATSSMQDAYGGVQQTNDALLSALLASESNFEQLAASQIDALKTTTTTAPVDTTAPTSSQQPGGSNSPIVSFAPAGGTFTGPAPQQAGPDNPYAPPGPTMNPNANIMINATQTQPREQAAAPYGGITSTRRTASGVTITTYASGRVVEQAPGHSSYVAHR